MSTDSQAPYTLPPVDTVDSVLLHPESWLGRSNSSGLLLQQASPVVLMNLYAPVKHAIAW